MYVQSTLKSTLQELLWEREQSHQSSYAKSLVSARLRYDQAAEVAASYEFVLADDYCFFAPNGVPIQLAMRLTNDKTGVSLVVICKLTDGEKIWYIADMTNAEFEAGVYISAVETRIERNHCASLEGKA